jgi:hypothetical protein
MSISATAVVVVVVRGRRAALRRRKPIREREVSRRQAKARLPPEKEAFAARATQGGRTSTRGGGCEDVRSW